MCLFRGSSFPRCQNFPTLNHPCGIFKDLYSYSLISAENVFPTHHWSALIQQRDLPEEEVVFTVQREVTLIFASAFLKETFRLCSLLDLVCPFHFTPVMEILRRLTC